MDMYGNFQEDITMKEIKKKLDKKTVFQKY